MYNVVLAAVLLAGGETTAWHSSCHGCHGYVGYCRGNSCHGCSGCYGCSGYAFRSCHGCSGCYGCSGCHGCYGSWGYSYYGSGCYGCTGCSGYSGCFGCNGGGVVIAMPACSGCHGCWGCYGSTMPPAGQPVMQTAPTRVMPAAGDPKVTPQNAAEREALEKLLRELREKKKSSGNDRNDGIVPTTARVIVNLPADARLWVDQVECPLTSAVRAFNTPELQPGQTYYYTVKMQVDRNGSPVTDSQRVLVSAGEQVTVNFNNLPALTTAQR